MCINSPRLPRARDAGAKEDAAFDFKRCWPVSTPLPVAVPHSPVHMHHPGPPLKLLPCCSCAGAPSLTAAGGSRPADAAQHVGRQRQLTRRLPRRVSHAQAAEGLLCHATACDAAATACPSSPTLCSCCVRICMCRHSRASANPIPHPVMNVKDEMEEDEDVEEHQSFLAGVFGVIYTVSRVSSQGMHV